jgi:hypothetical protein
MWEDGCEMLRRLTHSVEASSSRTALPALDVVVVRSEQERGHDSAPPTHFDEAQAERVLWQEFQDHGVSLNNTLNEALRIHGGSSWRVFQVLIFVIFEACSPVPFAFARF